MLVCLFLGIAGNGSDNPSETVKKDYVKTRLNFYLQFPDDPGVSGTI